MASRHVAARGAIRIGRPRWPLAVPASIPPCRQQTRWSSVSQKPGSDSVNFPGALNSKFVSDLEFVRPSQLPSIPTYRVIDGDGIVVDKQWKSDVDKDEILSWYRHMVTISVMDLIMLDAQRQGRIHFYIPNAGEEGIAIGCASALARADVVFAQYREAGLFAYRGFTLDQFMAQLFGNRFDLGKGRCMEVHYGSAALNVHTISSTLATQIPQASGAAYAVKMQDLMAPAGKAKRIVTCFFGEGAASEGDFHAGLNIAATRNCPIVFVCRNNGFAISTPTLEQYRGDGIASRGVGYGIETVRVDGNDVFAVREAMKEARRLALADGGKPVLVEAMSYRVSHHSTSDDSFAYRARVEVEDWKRRDNPITRLRKWMELEGIWDAEMEKTLRSETRRQILAAFARAEKEQKPPLRNMFTDVYEEMSEESKSHMRELREHLERYPDEYDLNRFESGIDSLKDDQ